MQSLLFRKHAQISDRYTYFSSHIGGAVPGASGAEDPVKVWRCPGVYLYL